jgi:hypothetical protein
LDTKRWGCIALALCGALAPVPGIGADGPTFEWIQTGDAVQDGGVSAGLASGDFDDDGDVDLFIANSIGFFQPAADTLYRNEGNGVFRPVENAATLHAGTSGGSSWADVDLDGDLDLAVANWQGQDNNLFGNPGTGAHWLRVTLRAAGANRRAIGAKLRLATRRDGSLVWQRRDVTAGSSFRSQEPAAQTFGLGSETRAAELGIEWPSGGSSV